MCVRVTKLWLWKSLVAFIVLAGVVTVVSLIVQSENWILKSPLHHAIVNVPFADKIEKNSTKSSSVLRINTKLNDKIITRKNPYITDPACQNFSISLYDDDTFEITGLVSYPGSGNTWTRHLIQLASGVYTGSFYFDVDLFGRGFYGEREAWYSGRTIVQKFHEKYDKRMNINRTILVIREPFPAILSFANYLEAGHTGNAYLLPYHHRDWPNFLLHSAYNWLSLAKSWIESPASVLVIHYELLKLQPVENVAKICSFLNHSCPYLLSPCFKKHLEGSFHRSKSSILKRMEKDETRAAKYPSEIKNVISRGIDHLNRLLQMHGQELIPLHLYQHYTPENTSATERL